MGVNVDQSDLVPKFTLENPETSPLMSYRRYDTGLTAT
jgi:hypothetical protein